MQDELVGEVIVFLVSIDRTQYNLVLQRDYILFLANCVTIIISFQYILVDL